MTKPSAKRTCSLKLKLQRAVLPFFLVFIILFSANAAFALKETFNNAVSTATVKTPSVTLETGDQGTSSISATSDYASATVTAGLTFNENASATVSTPAAPATDGSVFKGANAVTSSTTGNLNTGNANDIIYVVISILGTNAVSKVTNSGTALTWNKRAVVNDGTSDRVEAWYAISSARFTGQTITVSFGGTTTFTIIAFGISGAKTASPFDANSAVPATGTGSGTTQSVSVSTLNPNDYLIGAIAVMPASGNAPNPTSGAGFSNIQSNHQGSIGGGVESESVTSVQNSASVNCSTGGTSVSWAMIGDAVQGALPALSVNTAFSSTSSTGSVSISNGQSAFLWSPAYPSATTVNAGSWLLYLWALSATSDTMNVQLAATDSTGAITAVAASGNTGAIGTAKAEVKTTFSGLQISVPSGGHLLVILTNLAGGSSSFTIYWGSGQATNFRTPSLYNYALRVVNSAAVSFSVSFSAYSSSSITRLTNMTMYVYTPTTNCIIITNGAFTKSSSSTLSLSASSTFYLAVNATATDFNSVSNIVVLLTFDPGTAPFTQDVINLTVD